MISPRTATASSSTRAPLGSAATWNAERAGNASVKSAGSSERSVKTSAETTSRHCGRVQMESFLLYCIEKWPSFPIRKKLLVSQSPCETLLQNSHLAYTSLNAGHSPMSARNTVVFTTDEKKRTRRCGHWCELWISFDFEVLALEEEKAFDTNHWCNLLQPLAGLRPGSSGSEGKNRADSKTPKELVREIPQVWWSQVDRA